MILPPNFEIFMEEIIHIKQNSPNSNENSYSIDEFLKKLNVPFENFPSDEKILSLYKKNVWMNVMKKYIK